MKSSFLSHGEVVVESHDSKSRQACLQIVAPYCVIQATTPALLGAGLIDEFSLHNPVAVWIPEPRQGSFKSLVSIPYPDIASVSRNIVVQHVTRLLNCFNEVAQAMDDPSEIFPMLPLGTYVKVRYRCGYDKLGSMLEGMEESISGVSHLRFALAEALSFMLSEDQGRG